MNKRQATYFRYHREHYSNGLKVVFTAEMSVVVAGRSSDRVLDIDNHSSWNYNLTV